MILQEHEPQICPLCGEQGKFFFRNPRCLFYRCGRCKGIFLSQQFLPTRKEEEFRYRQHNNDINDPGYKAFVSPITDSVLKDFTSKHHGLDFGAGTGSVISSVLQSNGYDIQQYDPFFFDDPSLLKKLYDYIVCCEVMEHFHHPKKEFTLLTSMLNPNGILYCMTDLYHEGIDFSTWYYKNDSTHVFIYSAETCRWIAEQFKFSAYNINGRMIRFMR